MIRRLVGSGVATAVVLTAMLAPVHSQQRRPQPPPPAQSNAGPKKHLALVGGMLIDGYQVPPLHHAAILVEDNKIVEAGPASEVKIPADAIVIDTSGRVMMPGLIEEHAHLSILGHGEYNRWYPWIAQNGFMEKVMEISAKQLLMAGITTAVDLGAPLKESLSVRDRIKKGDIPGPHMLMSGPWVTRNLGNYPPEMNVMQKLINTPEEAAAATEELINAGVDVIKAYVQLTPAHYKAITDTAHKHRIRVHAHVYAEQDVRNALENGVDVQRQDDSRHRERRPSRRRHGGTSLVGVSGHGRVSGAAPGSAVEGRLRAGSRSLGRGATLAEEFSSVGLFRPDRS
jgi:hypothetical protein